MTKPRRYLADELAKKVGRWQVVVWDDRDRQYVDVARDVAPAGATFAAYDGSWFALRRQIEPLLASSERQAAVVYVPARRPDQDPLEELRAAGTSWTMGLRTLLIHALAGELTQARIDQLAIQARTLVEAEAALDAGGTVDPRLIAIFGTADLTRVAEEVLARTHDGRLDADGAWSLVGSALHAHLGTRPVLDRDSAPDVLFRHLALAVVADALGGLPDRLAPALGAVTPAQAAQCGAVLDRLHRPDRLAIHRALADGFDSQLGLPAGLSWDERLADVDVSPGLEELALAEGLRLLAAGEHGEAHRLAERRLTTSQWALPQPSYGTAALLPDHPHRRWAALSRIATLHQLVHDNPLPTSGRPSALLAWYAEAGWKVDQAHRLSELARADLGHLGGLDAHATSAQQVYRHWLEQVVTTTTAAIARHGLEVGNLARQGDTYFAHVQGKSGPTAYVQVDALRPELGHALADRLGRGGGEGEEAACNAAVAGVPTITPVGMPNLLPGAQDGLVVSLEGAKMLTSVGTTAIRTVPDRVAVIRRAAGAVLDLDLSALMARSDERLRQELAGMDVVLVRSTDIDAAGESGRAGTAWRTVDGIIDDLATQVLRLGRLGVRRVVISADHGFVVLPEQLSGARVLERPSGEGDMHMRCWVGRGGVTPDGAVRLPLAAAGIGGGLDLMVPEGLAVFPSHGSRQFFHGGLSPQELLVPVLVLDLEESPTPAVAPQLRIAVAGRGITTGAFVATITFTGSLFASEVAVRVMARSGSGNAQVARLVAGDGYDPVGRVVTVSSDPAALAFQLIVPLAKGSSVDVVVLDVGTGLELTRVAVPVLSSIAVEEDWL